MHCGLRAAKRVMENSANESSGAMDVAEKMNIFSGLEKVFVSKAAVLYCYVSSLSCGYRGGILQAFARNE